MTGVTYLMMLILALLLFAMMCGLGLMIASIRQRKVAWGVFALILSVAFVPLVFTFPLGGYPIACVIAVLLAVAAIFSFPIAVAMCPRRGLIICGLTGLCAFLSHVFLFLNTP